MSTTDDHHQSLQDRQDSQYPHCIYSEHRPTHEHVLCLYFGCSAWSCVCLRTVIVLMPCILPSTSSYLRCLSILPFMRAIQNVSYFHHIKYLSKQMNMVFQFISMPYLQC